MTLMVGKMYSFTYIIPGVMRKPRTSVLKYIDSDDEKYYFSGRPYVGTQEINIDWISEIHQVADDAAMMIDDKKLI